jgi:hypothetical protein
MTGRRVQAGQCHIQDRFAMSRLAGNSGDRDDQVQDLLQRDRGGHFPGVLSGGQQGCTRDQNAVPAGLEDGVGPLDAFEQSDGDRPLRPTPRTTRTYGRKLGDRYGHRRLLTVAIALVAAGSVLNAVAPTLGIMLIGRALQGPLLALLSLEFAIVRERAGEPASRSAGPSGCSSARWHWAAA